MLYAFFGFSTFSVICFAYCPWFSYFGLPGSADGHEFDYGFGLICQTDLT